jgi:hypothetical protein
MTQSRVNFLIFSVKLFSEGSNKYRTYREPSIKLSVPLLFSRDFHSVLSKALSGSTAQKTNKKKLTKAPSISTNLERLIDSSLNL